jgi:hypothetical protein
MPAPLKRAATVVQSVSFLRSEDFSQGGFIPNGEYLWSDLQFLMHTPTKKDGTIVGKPRLVCQITLEPLAGATTEEERKKIPYSLGTNAHLTYQPDPDSNGKKLKLVEGGPAAPLYEGTNFQILMKSLNDSTTLPPDLTTDDLSVLEGIVAHMTNIDEPESRKDFRSQSTGEVDTNSNRKNKILVVVEVKRASWMETADTPAPAPVKAATKPNGIAKVTPPVNKAVPAPAPAPTEGDDIVPNKVASILETNMNGMAKLGLRMAIFKSLKADGVDNPTPLVDPYFSDDAVLNELLNGFGYKLDGPQVVVQ